MRNVVAFAVFICLAAATIGLLMAILTLLLYVPILLMASQPAQILEGINYVADTLLFAGAALLVAGALPEDAPQDSSVDPADARGRADEKIPLGTHG